MEALSNSCKHVRERLEEPDLGQRGGSDRDNSDFERIVSLRDFKKLIHIKVDISMTDDVDRSSRYASNDEQGINGRFPEDYGPSLDNTTGKIDITPENRGFGCDDRLNKSSPLLLIDTVPASPETLTLVEALTTDEGDILLSHLPGLKEQRLPKLSDIIFDGQIPLVSTR